MTDPSSAPSSPPQPRRIGLKIALLGGLLLVWALLGVYIYFAMAAGRELQEATAEIDRRDAHWRLQDVEAARPAVADAKNSATTVAASKAKLPEKWPAWYFPLPEGSKDEAKRAALQASFADLPTSRQLDKAQIDALRAELKKAASALAEARKLEDMPDGRYPITYTDDFIGTLLPHFQDVRTIANLLALDALLRAQEEQKDEALASCRAVLNIGRSLDDEPLFESLLLRSELRGLAVRGMERTLAQGQPSEAALQKLQLLLEKEEAEPLLSIAVRGQRGGFDQFMDAIQTGKVRLSADDIEKAAEEKAEPKGTSMEKLALRAPLSVKSQRAAMLRYMTRAVEIAKMPPGPKQRAEITKLDDARKDQPLLVRLLIPSLSKIFAVYLRGRTELRCAIVAAAAERYRLDKKKWPDNLEALRAAGFLKKIPTDLYDEQPLRLRRLNDGLVIYSVGPDDKDNEGHMDRKNPSAEGADLGVRLWDAAKRRQSAP